MKKQTPSSRAGFPSKYIIMAGTKGFLAMKLMSLSSQMRRLARSKDKIGWRNFTKGREENINMVL